MTCSYGPVALAKTVGIGGLALFPVPSPVTGQGLTMKIKVTCLCKWIPFFVGEVSKDPRIPNFRLITRCSFLHFSLFSTKPPTRPLPAGKTQARLPSSRLERWGEEEDGITPTEQELQGSSTGPCLRGSRCPQRSSCRCKPQNCFGECFSEEASLWINPPSPERTHPFPGEIFLEGSLKNSGYYLMELFSLLLTFSMWICINISPVWLKEQ